MVRREEVLNSEVDFGTRPTGSIWRSPHRQINDFRLFVSCGNLENVLISDSSREDFNPETHSVLNLISGRALGNYFSFVQAKILIFILQYLNL